MAEWWEEAFRADYLRVYPHRDDDQAAADFAFARGLLPGLEAGRRVLDLACGAGRHLRAMRAARLRVIGADYSKDLLAAARSQGATELVRCDMRRLPFLDASFDAVTMFFSSFGYFATEEEDAGVLRESSRVLAPGGGVLLDLPWPTAVRRELVPRSERQVGETVIVEERSLHEEGRIVRKKVTLRRDGDSRSWTESLRLYSREEVLLMAVAAGLAERESTRIRKIERKKPVRMVLILEKAAA